MSAAHLIQVVGMHRSGTSAVTRVVNLLGASLGSHLMPSHPRDNPRGYWEHESVYQIHENLLSKLGRTWDDVRALPTGWLEQPASETARVELTDVLREDSAPLMAVKDPRMCLFAPLWQEVTDRLGYLVSTVVIVRHPALVMRSLQRRGRFPAVLSLLLWVRHTLGAVDAAEGGPRIVLSFEQVRQNPEQAVKLLQDFEVPWPDRGYRRRMEAASSVDSGTSNQTEDLRSPDGAEIDAGLWSAAVRLYEELAQRHGSQDLNLTPERELAEERMRPYEEAADQLSFLVDSEHLQRWRAVQLGQTVERLQGQLFNQRQEMAILKASDRRLRAVEASRSYKVLRRLQRLRNEWLRADR